MSKKEHEEKSKTHTQVTLNSSSRTLKTSKSCKREGSKDSYDI